MPSLDIFCFRIFIAFSIESRTSTSSGRPRSVSKTIVLSLSESENGKGGRKSTPAGHTTSSCIRGHAAPGTKVADFLGQNSRNSNNTLCNHQVRSVRETTTRLRKSLKNGGLSLVSRSHSVRVCVPVLHVSNGGLRRTSKHSRNSCPHHGDEGRPGQGKEKEPTTCSPGLRFSLR